MGKFMLLIFTGIMGPGIFTFKKNVLMLKRIRESSLSQRISLCENGSFRKYHKNATSV